MSAKYRKPPLSYVTAKLQFTSVLPERTSDQSAQLDQSMLLANFIIKETSKVTQYEMSVNDGDVSTSSPSVRLVERLGFFTRDRKISLIVDQNSLEFRTTEYKEYNDFIQTLESVREILLKIIPAFGKSEVKESVLSYVDIIVPDTTLDYNLSDFFNSEKILPSSHYRNKNSLFLAAKNEYNELVNDKHRVLVSLEELPQNTRKVVPDILIEFDNKFAMPINIIRMPNIKSQDSYVLLTTQSGQIHDKPFESVLMADIFKDSHDSCRKVFDSLIKHEVADLVWEREEK